MSEYAARMQFSILDFPNDRSCIIYTAEPFEMQKSNGILRTRQETYESMHEMVASLRDKYTEFLNPGQVHHSLLKAFMKPYWHEFAGSCATFAFLLIYESQALLQKQ